MKLIIAGANNFIGDEVLTQALITPTVTSIIAITTSPLQSSDPRVESLALDDFLIYQPAVSSSLAGADACVWTLGSDTMTCAHSTPAPALDYTMTAVRRLSKLPANEGKQFRFVQTSSKLLEKDGRRSPTLFTDPKYESDVLGDEILEFANLNQHALKAFVVKPSAVLPKQDPVMEIVMRALPNIQVELMAAAMLDFAIHGHYEPHDPQEQAHGVVPGKRTSTGEGSPGFAVRD